ncbi:hypothetical protein [Parabacteroides sp.]
MYRPRKNTIDFTEQKAMEKGRDEDLKEGKRSVALNLKKKGLCMEQISRATGLSLEEIEALG